MNRSSLHFFHYSFLKNFSLEARKEKRTEKRCEGVGKRENEILLSVRKGQSFNSVPGHRLTVVFYSVTLRRIDSFSHSLLLILSHSIFLLLYFFTQEIFCPPALLFERSSLLLFPVLDQSFLLLDVQTFPSFFKSVHE